MNAFNQQQQVNPNNPNNDVIVPQPPSDTISSLSLNSSNLLVASSWDNSVKCWEIQRQQNGMIANILPKAQITHDGPVLCTDFSPDGTMVFSGGCDRSGKMWNLNAPPGTPPQQVAAHDGPIKSLKFHGGHNLLITGSWDRTVKVWDCRQPQPTCTVQLPDRLYDLDVVGNVLAVVTATRQIIVYDLSNPGAPTEYKRFESPLKYSPRCIRVFPDQGGIAFSSIEGRVGIQYMNQLGVQSSTQNFVFKCHRTSNTNTRPKQVHIFSVNDISFNHMGTFSTAGADGCFHYWDKKNRIRLQQFSNMPHPITCTSFSPSSDLFAYATGYDWSKGAAGNVQSAQNQQPIPAAIYLHAVPPAQITPRKKGERK